MRFEKNEDHYSFNSKEIIQFLNDSFDVSNDDAISIFETMLYKNWIESPTFEKKFKENSIYNLVRKIDSFFSFQIFF